MLLVDLPTSIFFAASVATFLSALVQGTIGFGYAVISVPILSLLSPGLAPVPQLLTALPLTVISAWRERTNIDMRGMTWVLVGRIPGVFIGAWLVTWAAQRTLDLLISGSVLAAVVILARRKGALRRNRVMDFTVGAYASFSSYVSAIGGPPLALLFRNESGATVRATLGALFTLGLVLTLAVRAAAGQISRADVVNSTLLIPSVLLGVLVSKGLHGRVEGPPLKTATLILSTAAAVALASRAFAL